MGKERKPSQISAKHKVFCEEYLVDFNATRAYQVVYPNVSDTTACCNASILQTKPTVKEYLARRVEERNAELKIDQSFVINKLKEIVAADYTDAIQNLSKEDFENIPASQRKLIQSVKIKKSRQTFNHGKEELENETYQVTFMSKDLATELLGKHTGAFAKDNEKTVTVKGFAAALKDLDI